jgi:hypothetical protein
VAYDDPDTDGAVTVFEAGPSGLTLVAASDAACQAWDWTRDGRLTMTCTESDAKGQRLLAADLVRRGAGWRIEPGAELDRQTRRRLDRPSKPLVDVEVPAVADDGSEEETYEIEKGYRRLVPNPPIPTKVAIQAEGR